ncbi:hypothetical protein KR018_008587 [Drosophila ironensis]|nr:hypothetical protein KR018_008587 [Drosophila ironensis]
MSNKTAPEAKKLSRQRRKPTIWTREKISKLIELYRKSDCLWNHYSELYKNKDCRAKAIEQICAALGITKNDYGKKVHNLRNQFNSELKKLERRVEESGGSSPSAEKTCRWEHFKTLMFLRSVIEPRPGYQQTPQSQCKVPLQISEIKTKVNLDIRYFLQKMITTLEYSFSEKEEKHSQSSVDSLESIILETATETLNEPLPTVVEPLAAPILCATAPPSRLAPATEIFAAQIPTNSRDQWDAFGELIATEFRNLNSEISRKRLKRRIMQVMLEIGEEDDREFTGQHS